MIGVAEIGLGERAERALSEILQETTNEIGIGLCHGFKKISGRSIVGSVFRATTTMILTATSTTLLPKANPPTTAATGVTPRRDDDTTTVKATRTTTTSATANVGGFGTT